MRLHRRLVAVPVLALTAVLVGVAAAPAAEAASTLPAREAAAFAQVLAGSGTTLTAQALGEDGSVLAAVKDTTSLPPASTQKIATIGTALAVLGPTHRFRTVLQGTAPLPPRVVWKGVAPRGVYGGALVVVGGGDPSLRTAGLTSLLSTALARGIRTVTGGLWLDTSTFDHVHTAPGWKPEWVGTEVGPISAFMLEQNLGRTDAAYLRDPDTGNLTVIQSWLTAHGVTVRGGLHVGLPAAPLRATFGSWASEPLSVLAQVTLRDSVNTWAEVLLKDVGAASGEGSTARGITVEARTLAAAGASFGTAADGSGLSSLNRMNAAQELSILRAYGTSAVGLLDDLPVSCVSGTMQHRLCALPGRVHAKTGTLDTLSALTGYVIDTAGNRLWFSVQVGGALSTYRRTTLIDRAVLALSGQ